MPTVGAARKMIEDEAGRARLSALYGEEGLSRAADRMDGLEASLMELRGGRPEESPRFYSAPGRTELGGNHTDHNHGRVLAAAVRLDALACVAPRAPGDLGVRIRSEGWADPIVLDLAGLEPRPEEAGRTEALVRGVARGLADRGVAIGGFDAAMDSTVLPGSGLSSSAAVEVLFGTILADLAGAGLGSAAAREKGIDAVELAKIGQYAENRFFGKPCGLMDQTASAVGGVVAIDFALPSAPAVRSIPFAFAKAGLVLCVVNTGGSHADLTADYAAVPAEMKAVASFLGKAVLREVDPALLVERGPAIRAALGDRALLRALHFAAEDARVPAMVAALERNDVAAYLGLVRASGDSSWRLLQNLYPPEAPHEQGLPLALALSERFLAGEGAVRVHGGGFAGTIQAYVPLARFEGWKALMESYFGPGSVHPIGARPLGTLRLA